MSGEETMVGIIAGLTAFAVCAIVLSLASWWELRKHE